MSVNLSIKNVPDAVARRLKQQAKRNRRSLQGELLVILEEAARSSRSLTPEEAIAEVRRLGLRTPAEAARSIRADRDAR